MYPRRANDTSCIVLLVVASQVEGGTAATLFVDFADESSLGGVAWRRVRSRRPRRHN
jgi:hypothetical protein